MYSLSYIFSKLKGWSLYSKSAVVACSFTLSVACILFLTCTEAKATSVYDGQPHFTNEELASFIELLPHFRAWAIPNNIKANPVVNKDGKADFIYSQEAAEWVLSNNWKPERFFFVMGRAAAALAVIEEGNDLLTRRPTDMPVVPEEELRLVRRHLGSLLKAGSEAPPLE